METNPIPRLGIPGLSMADGPHGLRKQTGAPDNGVSHSEPATSFPTAVALASSWDLDLARAMGAAIAAEARFYGVHILLGPGVNIKRNPLCGRNFEYYSEDPLLTGDMGVSFVEGVQGGGVGVSVKHFAVNNQENFRYMGESVVDERALREIYFRPFEKIVKEARPATLMCAYNQLWGEYCSENRRLLNTVLREEWGFDGVVMTDWGAAKDRAKGVASGLDLEMPGDTAYGRRRLLDGVRDGSLPMEQLDEAVRNVLHLIDQCTGNEETVESGAGPAVDWTAHHDLAGEIAKASAVLLQNDGTLPLDRGARLLVVGDLFERMRYQGSGSSMVNPTMLTTPKEAFDARDVRYAFERGYDEGGFEADGALIEAAVKAAADVDTIVFFGGLTDTIETEAGDRTNMALPPNQVEVAEALAATGKPIVVVLFGGSPMEIPFAEKVNSILNMYLPGQKGGDAVAALLFGEANPGGKLAETWPMTYGDVPFGEQFSVSPVEVYKESVFVGYRYYGSADKPVRWPFGHGLSYTEFAYSNLSVQEGEGRVTVTCDVTNTGNVAGAEVVQLYVGGPPSDVPKPRRELRAFDKVFLAPGETKRAVMRFRLSDLAYYDARRADWVLEKGIHRLEIGASSTDLRLEEELVVEGEGAEKATSPYDPEVVEAYSNLTPFRVSDEVFEKLLGRRPPAPPPSLPLTMESVLTDFEQTFFGRIVLRAVLSVAHRLRRRALRLPPGPERDNRLKGAAFMARILSTSSPRSLTMAGPDSLPYHWARAFVELGNGRIVTAIKQFFSPVKVPPLPKEQ